MLSQNMPQDAISFTNRGLAKNDLGRYEEAIADYDQAITLNPRYAVAFSNRGLAKYNLKRYEEAIADYNQAIALNLQSAISFSNRGLAKYNLNRYEEAIADYDQAIALNPQYANAFAYRGDAKNNLGRHPEAIADYDQAIALNPQYANAFANRGDVKKNLGRYEEAIADYDQAIALKPQNATTFDNRGDAKKNLGRYEEAIADYDQAIALNPQYAFAFCHRGLAKYKLARYQEAIADYDQAITLLPFYPVALTNRGLAKYKLARYQEAIADYDQVITLLPFYFSALANRGLAKYNLKSYEEAIADYDQAIALNPRYAINFYNRGLAKDHLGRHQEAIADLDQAIALNPRYAFVFAYRGDIKNRLGDYQEAIADYDQAIALNPQDASHLEKRALAKGHLGRYEEAIADYDQAIALNPQLAIAFSNRGSAKYHLARYQEAIADYDQAIALNPQDAISFSSRGDAKKNLDRYQEAIADYDQAIALNPQSPISFTRRALAKYHLGRYQEAIADYDQAIALVPCWVPAFTNRGLAKSKLGHYQEAIADYDQAIALNPRYATAFANRGDAKKNLGRYEEAIADYDQAIALNPQNVDALVHLRLLAKKALAEVFSQFIVLACEEGKLAEAVEKSEELIKLTPHEATAHYKLACFYWVQAQQAKDQNNPQEYQAKLAVAEQTFKIALQLQEESPTSSVQAEFAHFLYHNNRFEEALIHLNKAIQLKQDNSELFYTKLAQFTVEPAIKEAINFHEKISIKGYLLAYYLLLKIHLQLDQLPQAKVVLTEFAQEVATQNDALLYLLLGHIYQQLGERQQATQTYQKAIEIYQPTVAKPEYTLAKEGLEASQPPKPENNPLPVNEDEHEAPFEDAPQLLTAEEEQLHRDIDALEAEREDTLSQISVSSSQFQSNDKKKIAQELLKRINDDRIAPLASVSIKPNQALQIKLEQTPANALTNQVLINTFKQLFPADAFNQVEKKDKNQLLLTLHWNSLEATQVRNFKKVFFEQKAGLQAKEIEKLKEQTQNSTKRQVVSLLSQIGSEERLKKTRARQAFEQFLADVKQDIKPLSPLTCFISHAWEDEETPAGKAANIKINAWLKQLQQDLQQLGLHVLLDVSDMHGKFNDFMVQQVPRSEVILLIGTPRLKQRLEEGFSALRLNKTPNNMTFEFTLIQQRLRDYPALRILPLLYQGTVATAFPAEVDTGNGVYDFSMAANYYLVMMQLIPHLFLDAPTAHPQYPVLLEALTAQLDSLHLSTANSQALQPLNVAQEKRQLFNGFLQHVRSLPNLPQNRPLLLISAAEHDPDHHHRLQQRVDVLQADLEQLGNAVEHVILTPYTDLLEQTIQRQAFILFINTPALVLALKQQHLDAFSRKEGKALLQLIHQGKWNTALPQALQGHMSLDLTDPEKYFLLMAQLSGPKGIIPCLYDFRVGYKPYERLHTILLEQFKLKEQAYQRQTAASFQAGYQQHGLFAAATSANTATNSGTTTSTTVAPTVSALP